jgi:hypothetical protein
VQSSETQHAAYQIKKEIAINKKVETTPDKKQAQKGQRSLAERRFIHALIHEAEIVLRYTNSRE